MPEMSLRADVLLVVTEAECLTAALHLLLTAEEHTLPTSGTIVWIDSLDSPPDRAVLIGLTYASGDSVAALTQETITALRPSYTIYLGLGGAVAGDLKIGDIIAAAPLYAIDYGEEGKTFHPHPRASRPSHRMEQRARAEANRFEWQRYGLDPPNGETASPRAYVQPVASGRVLLQRGADGLAWLRDNYADTLAVMRAGEDFIAASAVQHTISLVLCGISHDLHTSTPATPTTRRLSARSCVAFAFAMIAKLGPAPNGGRPEPEPEPEPEPLIDVVDAHRKALFRRLAELEAQKQAAMHEPDHGRLAQIEQESHDIRAQLRAGPQLCVGEVLGKRYKLIKQIGSGGFATVYHAYDHLETRNVALKVLHANLGAQDEIRVRFFRGARRMAELGGSGAVRVTDFGGSDRGYHYFAMDLLEGHLRTAVTASRATTRERLSWIAQVGRTLGAAHDLRIIHRDVRPENILMDAQNRARLTDFDIARIPEGTQYTESSSMGTYLYAAPEQLHNTRIVTARADIYSLALVALFVVTRADPDSDALQRDRNGLIERLPIPGQLKLILARALAFRARDRHYTDANDFCRDLEECLATWEAPADEAVSGTKLGLVAALNRLSDRDFERVVAQLESEDAGWRCRRGPRLLRAVDVLQIAERRASPTWSQLIRSPRIMPDAALAERGSIPGDWEDIFHWLCELPPDAFAALMYAYEFESTAPAQGPISNLAADVIRRVALAQDEHRFVDQLVHFVRFIAVTPTACRVPTTPANLGWMHCKLRLALTLLAYRRAPEDPEAPSDLSLALARYDYGELLRLLGDIQRWKHIPLDLTRWVGRARVLAAEALTLANASRDAAVALLSPMPRFALYHGLCRLADDAWNELCGQFVVPWMLSQTASRAEQAIELLDCLVPHTHGLLQRFFGEFEPATEASALRAVGLPPAPIKILEPPPVLQSEWSLRAQPAPLHPACAIGWKDLQPRLQDSDPGWLHYRDMRREIFDICGLQDNDAPESAIADNSSGTTETALFMLRRLGAEELMTIWEALRIPRWYQPSPETPPDKIADQLVAFLRWLLPTDWADAVIAAEGDPTRFILWLHHQRNEALPRA